MKATEERPNTAAGPVATGTSRRSAGLALVATAAAIALAGCGGGSKPPAVVSVAATTETAAASTPASTGASGGATSTPAGSGSGSASSETPQQEGLKYSRCMRANGVPAFPDPLPGGGFAFSPGSGVDPTSPAFKAAQAKCQQFMGGPSPGSTTHPSAQWLAHMVKVAQCMRRHGISNFPDPTTSVPANPFPNGGTGLISDIQGVILVFPSTIDTQSPLFTRAATACGFPLHNH
jgi:hypothetical protein